MSACLFSLDRGRGFLDRGKEGLKDARDTQPIERGGERGPSPGRKEQKRSEEPCNLSPEGGCLCPGMDQAGRRPGLNGEPGSPGPAQMQGPQGPPGVAFGLETQLPGWVGEQVQGELTGAFVTAKAGKGMLSRRVRLAHGPRCPSKHI